MKKELQSIIQDLEKLATDLPEVRIQVDAEYQAERLRKLIERLRKISDLPAPAIHGGGTGED